MNIGGLYTYPDQRRLHTDYSLDEWIGHVSEQSPFVMIEVKQIIRRYHGHITVYKILTADGEIGWIYGMKEYFKEVTP